MTSHRLDTAKLAAAIDRRRGAGTRQEVSFREISRIIGHAPSTFTRINDGHPPSTDALCSLLMWLGPGVCLRDFILEGDRRQAPRPVSRRRQYDHLGTSQLYVRLLA